MQGNNAALSPPSQRATIQPSVHMQSPAKAYQRPTDGAGNSDLPLTGSPPSCPGCPSAQAGQLSGVTWLSRLAAASPRTPACTGAPSSSSGRGGRTGDICRDQRANSSWVMPCWVSGGDRLLPAALLPGLGKE